MENNYIVYKHTSPSGKVYIGITSQTIQRRWRNGEGYKQCKYFYRAIEKYGWKYITHEIIENGLTRCEASEKEKYYISFYKSNNFKFGYNLDSGGLSGRVINQEIIERSKKFRHTEETKERLRQISLEYFKTHPGTFLGRHHTEETKRKIADAHRGKPGHPMSKVNKEKLIAAIKGKPRSLEHCKHISESKKGVYAGDKNPRAKAVRCIETGDVFTCAKYAADWLGVSGGNHNIISVCTGNLKSAYGYHWEYA